MCVCVKKGLYIYSNTGTVLVVKKQVDKEGESSQFTEEKKVDHNRFLEDELS